MTKYMADFLVDSDLCLENDNETLSFTSIDNKFTLFVSNAVKDNQISDAVLSMQIIYEAEDIKIGVSQAKKIIAEALNCLTYVTDRKFVFKAMKRVFDWTPGLVMRDALIFDRKPVWEYAEPGFDSAFMATTQQLLGMISGEAQQMAMRNYRLGVQAEVLEDQFSNFWFALEVASENLKTSEKIPSKCPKCKEALYCETCGVHPTHKRFPIEAIQQTIERVHPENADEVYNALSKIRHTLMHGKSIASVIDELPCSEEEAVNKLANIARVAIDLMFKEPPENSLDDIEMMFGQADNIVRRSVTAIAVIQTTLLRDHENPQIENLPGIQANLISKNPREK